MPDFSFDYPDDPRSELERKAAQLKWVALAETFGYGLLAFAWLVLKNDAATKVLGWFHGWITVVLIVMVVWIFPSVDWRWYWLPLSLAPVIGGILLFENIRRNGAPPRPVNATPKIIVRINDHNHRHNHGNNHRHRA